MLRFLKQYYPVRNAVFIIGEFYFIYFCIILTSYLFMGHNQFSLEHIISRKAFTITIICIICLYYNDLYNLKEINTYAELSIRLFQSLGVATIILSFIYILFHELIVAKEVFIISIILAILIIISWRFGYNFILSRGIFNQKIIILGSGELAAHIIHEINDKRDCGYTIKKIIPDSDEEVKFADKNLVLNVNEKGYTDLTHIAEGFNVSKIIVAMREKRGSLPVNELLNCRVAGIEIIDGNSFYEMLTGKIYVKQINPGWFVFSEGFKRSVGQYFLKRITDIFASTILLIITLPIIIITAVIIKIESKGPVIFSQERIGENKKKYTLYKFRSMISGAETGTGPVWAQLNDSRITRVGKFIRQWRIDEIPQLWNILKGDMSFVGPRPEREFFINKLETIIPFYKVRFSVKPGLTGWAQINYRYSSSEDDALQKLNYELFYVKNMSLLIDLTVIARTIHTVLFSKGAR